MNEHQISKFGSSQELIERCAQDLCQLLASEQAKQRRKPRIVLTGGRLGQALIKELAKSKAGFDWSSVWIAWGDERLVPSDSPESNSGEALRAFPGLAAAHVFRYPTERDLVFCRDSADAELAAELKPIDSSPLFDLVMLGIGEDGHVASIFPGAVESVAGSFGLVAAVDKSPKPPAQRLTLTEAALNRSREVWYLAAGPEKRGVVASSVQGNQSLPAGRVRGLTLTRWFLDEAAAADL